LRGINREEPVWDVKIIIFTASSRGAVGGKVKLASRHWTGVPHGPIF
jgi:hypothetical protein